MIISRAFKFLAFTKQLNNIGDMGIVAKIWDTLFIIGRTPLCILFSARPAFLSLSYFTFYCYQKSFLLFSRNLKFSHMITSTVSRPAQFFAVKPSSRSAAEMLKYSLPHLHT